MSRVKTTYPPFLEAHNLSTIAHVHHAIHDRFHITMLKDIPALKQHLSTLSPPIPPEDLEFLWERDPFLRLYVVYRFIIIYEEIYSSLRDQELVSQALLETPLTFIKQKSTAAKQLYWDLMIHIDSEYSDGLPIETIIANGEGKYDYKDDELQEAFYGGWYKYRAKREVPDKLDYRSLHTPITDDQAQVSDEQKFSTSDIWKH